MTTNIFNPEYRRAMIFCGVAVIGAVLYGYDGTYYTSILEMEKFKHDFGERQSDGTYDITSTIRSVVSRPPALSNARCSYCTPDHLHRPGR